MEALGTTSPVLQYVADCESGTPHIWDTATQYTDGTTTIGISGDIGILQENPIHLKEAAAMGLDIYTFQDNVKFGAYLYDKYGLKPWRSSERCWGPQVET